MTSLPSAQTIHTSARYDLADAAHSLLLLFIVIVLSGQVDWMSELLVGQVSEKNRQSIKSRITDAATTKGGMNKNTQYDAQDLSSYMIFANIMMHLQQLPLSNNRRFAISQMCNKYTAQGRGMYVCSHVLTVCLCR